MFALKIEKRAEKFINRLSSKDQDIVFSKLSALRTHPYKNNLDIKKLHGSTDNIFRLRIRDIRIIYKIYNKELIILVIDAGFRKDIYRK